MKFRIIILALLMPLSGCVKASKTRQPHEPAISQERLSTPAPTQEVQVEIAADWRSLSKEILNNSFLSQFEKYDQKETAQKLWKLNESLLQALRAKGADQSEAQNALKLYSQFLLSGCTFDLNRCQYLNVFRRASNVSTILKVLAQQEQDLKKYYRWLYLALSLKSSEYDSELLVMIAARSADYIQALKGSEKVTLDRFVRFLNDVLKQLASRTDKNLATSIVSSMKLDEMSQLKTLLAHGVDVDALLELMNRAGGFSQKMIQGHFAGADNIIEVQKRITKNGALSKQLSLDPIQTMDQTTFVLDMGFLDQFTSDQVIRVIRSQNVTASDLKKQIRQVYTIRFLEALLKTTKVARDQFFDKQVADDAFFIHSLRSGSSVTPIWGAFIASSQSFQKVALTALRDKSATENDLEEIRLLFDGLSRNIKFMSVYPQMMALTYHMSKRNAKIVVSWLGRTFQFDSTTIISDLFTGVFDPWFDYYPGDQTPLSFVELLYAFDFALRTGIFEEFKVDPDDFVAEITDRLARQSTRKVKDYLNLVEQRMASASFTNMRAFCRQVDSGQPLLRLTIDGFRTRPLIGDIEDALTETIGSKSGRSPKPGEVEKIIQGMMVFDHLFTTAAEETRVDLGNVERWLGGLLSSYRGYLDTSKSTEAASRVGRSQEILAQIRQTRVDFLKKAIAMFRELDNCYSAAIDLDEAIKLQLISEEEKYLREVHKDITAFRKGQTTLANIAAKHAFRGLPSDFKGLSRFHADSYDYYQVDVLLRSSRRLQEMHPGVIVDLPYKLDLDVPHVKESSYRTISYSESEDEFVSRGIYALLGYPGFLSWYRLGGILTNWRNRNHAATILYRVNEPELVKAVCTANPLCASPTELVSAKELINQHENMLKKVKFSDYERHVMRSARISAKLEPLMFGLTLIEYDYMEQRVRQVKGLYDFPAYVVTRDILGIMQELNDLKKMGHDGMIASLSRREAYKHIDYKKLGDVYVLVRGPMARKSLMFKPSQSLDQNLDRSVGVFVRGEIGRIEHFLGTLTSHLKAVSQLAADQRPRFDLNLKESYTEPLLNDSIVLNFKVELEQFHRKTEFCFSEKGCATLQ